MVKRRREDEATETKDSAKRIKPSVVDRLSRLSDELTLRVLSFLPVAELVVCQR